MPRKVFTAGEILTAADVNTNLMDQSVMVFDDATARTTAIPTPVEGMVTYLKDTDRLEQFDGTNFVVAAPAQTGVLQVVQGTKTNTFTTSLTSGSTAVITDFEASITPASTSNKILVMVSLTAANQSNGVGYLLNRGGTGIGLGDSVGSRTPLTFGGTFNVGGQSPQPGVGVVLDSPATVSSVTYSVTAQNVSNTTSNYFFNRTETDADAARSGRFSSTITLMEVAG